jgi:hypothetical protein
MAGKGKEEWRWHPDFNERYAVSTWGRVAHYQYYIEEKGKRPKPGTPKIVEPFEDGFGRLMVAIHHPEYEQFKPMHVFQLVLETFVGPLFINGNKNNCSLANLGWKP